MNKKVGGDLVWAVIALIGWVLPWGSLAIRGSEDTLWGYQVKTGMTNDMFLPGVMVPAMLVVFFVVAIWAMVQSESSQARMADTIMGLLAGIACVAQGLPIFILASYGAPFVPGIGAVILVISGAALVIVTLRSKVHKDAGAATDPNTSPAESPSAVESTAPAMVQENNSSTTWQCDCGEVNINSQATCRRCEQPRPQTAATEV